MLAALNQGDFNTKPGEELGELARNCAAAENDERLGELLQRHGVVARDEPDVIQLGQGHRRHAGTGGDDKVFGRECSAIAQFDRVRIEKSCAGTDEFEYSAVQLLHAEIGEILYLRVLSRHDPGEVEGDFPRFDAPSRGVFSEVFYFRCIKEGL